MVRLDLLLLFTSVLAVLPAQAAEVVEAPPRPTAHLVAEEPAPSSDTETVAVQPADGSSGSVLEARAVSPLEPEVWSAPDAGGRTDETRGSAPAPAPSIVPSRAWAVELTGIGITLVGVSTYVWGQFIMDAGDRMPVGEARDDRINFGRSIRGGGLGFVVVGVSTWLIAGELARWNANAPSVGFVPIADGGAVTFSMRLP